MMMREVWVANDKTEHDTQEAAEQHDATAEIVDYLESEESGGLWWGRDGPGAEEVVATLLKRYTIVKREVRNA
jgi:hypothetical protein